MKRWWWAMLWFIVYCFHENEACTHMSSTYTKLLFSHWGWLTCHFLLIAIKVFFPVKTFAQNVKFEVIANDIWSLPITNLNTAVIDFQAMSVLIVTFYTFLPLFTPKTCHTQCGRSLACFTCIVLRTNFYEKNKVNSFEVNE